MSTPFGPSSGAPRDYGATCSSSTSNVAGNSAAVPDVNFSSFSPTEFMTLCQVIGQNIQTVNICCKQLEKIYKTLKTPREHHLASEQIHKIETKANSRIEGITMNFQRLAGIVRSGDKQQKLQLEKLTNDFHLVLEKYFTLQQLITTALRRAHVEILKLEAIMDSSERNDSTSDTTPDKLDKLQLRKSQYDHQLLLNREQQIKHIESAMLDVNSIMRTLRTNMQMQGEEVDLIENNIEQTVTEVELGQQQLAKATRLRNKRYCKVFVLIAIAVIIGLIVTGIIIHKYAS